MKDSKYRLAIILCGFATVSNTYYVLHSDFIHDQFLDTHYTKKMKEITASYNPGCLVVLHLKAPDQVSW